MFSLSRFLKLYHLDNLQVILGVATLLLKTLQKVKSKAKTLLPLLFLKMCKINKKVVPITQNQLRIDISKK